VPAVPRVLVVEDQVLIQDLLQAVFTHAGFETIVAGTAADALEKLNSRPDYCTLDLHLPDGSGARVLQRIREELLTTKVALTTGAVSPAILAEATRWKPERIFHKPYSALDLVVWMNSYGSAQRRMTGSFPPFASSSARKNPSASVGSENNTPTR
jgi:two-component system CitB family response regulator